MLKQYFFYKILYKIIMKKILATTLAILAISSLAFADDDIFLG